MKTMKIKRILATVLAMTLTAMLFCTFPGCADDTPVATVMILGIRENVPEPDLNSRVFRDCVDECVRTNGYIAAMVCDSDPTISVEYDIVPPAQSGLSSRKLKKIADKKTTHIIGKLGGLCAETGEADLLTAFYRASQTLSSSTFDGMCRKIVVYDNGLSTAATLNFAAENILGSEPESIAAQVAELFPLNLSGLEIEWYGLGSTDSDDEQAALYPQNVLALQSIWNAILADAGATVNFMSDSVGKGAERDNLPKVSPVAIINPGIVNGFDPEAVTMLSDSEIAFVKNTVEYIDPAAAKATLKPIADYMKANPDFNILVGGTTATVGQNASCVKFSHGRAEKVKSTLIELGVAGERIKSIGLGFENKFHVNDIDANGNLIENFAQKNRTVVVLNLDSDIARELTTA